MNWRLLIAIVDWLLFIEVVFTVLYLLFFAVASLFKRKDRFLETNKQNRILVLIPAYKEDYVIENTVRTFLQQDYPKNLYDVTIISDHMREETNRRLSQQPITLLTTDFERSSKARSLDYAINNSGNFKRYDIVIVLDADNTVEYDFLYNINKAFEGGSFIIQAHRISKNRNTETALLDAIFEEVNNSIFRLGHVCCGLSAALVGSGIAYPYQWFRDHVGKAYTSGEDKEFEEMIMKENIFVDYLNDVYVFDEKVQNTNEFNRQRRRWLAAQYHSFITNFYNLPKAIWTRNYDYADKILQWAMLPRIIMVGIIGMMSILLPFLDLGEAVKWWGIALLLIFVFALAAPDYLVNKNFNKTLLCKIPVVVLGMMLNIFRLHGLKNKFLHVEHKITDL